MYFVKIGLLLHCYHAASGIGVIGYRSNLEKAFPQYNETVSTVTTKWIELPVDELNTKDTRTFQLRYFENLNYWQENGPIYLFISGESPASQHFIEAGTTVELAQETNGALYLAEHRYYGESKPLDIKDVHNLAYLSSEQALADLAQLLRNIKSSPAFAASQVVVVGGSYAGNLAAWLKLLYPDLVDAAISSSGPVLAKKDFYEYLETVSDVLRQYGGVDCANQISKRFSKYDQLFQSENGIDQLKEEESICANADMSNVDNQRVFFLFKVNRLSSTVQYGNPDEIKAYCRNPTSSYVFSFGSVSINVWDKSLGCASYDFDGVVASFRQQDEMWLWMYQSCTEFGYFQSTSSDHHIFTKNIPVDLYYKICSGLYGDEFNERRVDEGVRKTNQRYGGLTPNVKNVVFVHGDMDPWYKLGVIKDLSDDAPAIVINGASHCNDLMPDSSNGNQTQAVQRVKNLIKKWIGV